MSELMTLLTADTAAPGILLAAVAHGELVGAGPFRSGNGVVARAVEQMLLVQTGVDPSALITPRHGPRAAYQAAVAAYATGTVSGVRDWLVRCCGALTAGAEALAGLLRSN